jgi:hypothetical protein
MAANVQDVAAIVGMVLGTCLILTVCFVWIRKQVCGISGLFMSIAGVVLVGLTLDVAIVDERDDTHPAAV